MRSGWSCGFNASMSCAMRSTVSAVGVPWPRGFIAARNLSHSCWRCGLHARVATACTTAAMADRCFMTTSSLPSRPQGSFAGGQRASPQGPWALPARIVDHLVLDSGRATLLYWGSTALVIGGLFDTQLLPCVDYPQHLALSDIARRLSDPAAPERAEYQLNYFTYNGLFHIVVARLGTLLPIELAGRLVVAASLGAMAAAVLALVRTLGRPPVHAALFTPILFSFSVGWGFANYVLATAIAA